jgi:hypothetical protein
MTARPWNTPASHHKYFALFALAFGLVLTPIWAVIVSWIPVRTISAALLWAFADF